MVSLTATLFKSIMHDSSIQDATAENIIDYAISEITLHSGEDMAVMSGTAGSKTVSLTTQQYGAVMEAGRAIYQSCYKGVESSGVGGVTVTDPDVQSNPVVQAAIRRAARRLATFDVDYG